MNKQINNKIKLKTRVWNKIMLKQKKSLKMINKPKIKNKRLY